MSLRLRLAALTRRAAQKQRKQLQALFGAKASVLTGDATVPLLEAAGVAPYFAGGAVIIMHSKPRKAVFLGHQLGTAVVLDGFLKGSAEEPRRAVVVEWPTLAAAKRAGHQSVAGLHAAVWRYMVVLHKVTKVCKPQKRGKKAGDRPLWMVGVTARLRGKLTGWKQSVKRGFGLWRYRQPVDKDITARVLSKLCTDLEPGVNATWKWAEAAVPGAAALLAPVKGAWCLGLAPDAKENDERSNQLEAKQVALGCSGFACTSAGVNYHAGMHTDTQDLAGAGTALLAGDITTDSKPAPGPTVGNNMLWGSLGVEVEWTSATHIWGDTKVYTHKGTKLTRQPPGVVRVTTARLSHAKVIEMAANANVALH